MIEGMRAISTLLVTIFILMVGFGLGGYIVQLRALGEGWSPYTISLIGAVYSAGYTLSSFITPRFIRMTGHIRVFAAFIALMSISILLCALAPHPVAWMAFRFLFGFSIAGGYMCMESWINEKATNENRGFMFSLYMVTTMGGSIVGPYIASLSDPMTSTLFMITAILLSIAIFPIALTPGSTPSLPKEAGFDLRGLWVRSPAAFVGTFLSGVIAASWMNFSAVYAKMSGMTKTDGANLIAAVILGSVVSQFPLGRISDHIDRRIVMVGCGIFGVIASVLLALSDASNVYLVYAAGFAAGMVIFPIYSINVAHANDLAEPGEYVRISSGITVLYGIGVIAGPLLTGQAISTFGPSGLPILLAVNFAFYGAYSAWRLFRRP